MKKRTAIASIFLVFCLLVAAVPTTCFAAENAAAASATRDLDTLPPIDKNAIIKANPDLTHFYGIWTRTNRKWDYESVEQILKIGGDFMSIAPVLNTNNTVNPNKFLVTLVHVDEGGGAPQVFSKELAFNKYGTGECDYYIKDDKTNYMYNVFLSEPQFDEKGNLKESPITVADEIRFGNSYDTKWDWYADHISTDYTLNLENQVELPHSLVIPKPVYDEKSATPQKKPIDAKVGDIVYTAGYFDIFVGTVEEIKDGKAKVYWDDLVSVIWGTSVWMDYSIDEMAMSELLSSAKLFRSTWVDIDRLTK